MLNRRLPLNSFSKNHTCWPPSLTHSTFTFVGMNGVQSLHVLIFLIWASLLVRQARNQTRVNLRAQSESEGVIVLLSCSRRNRIDVRDSRCFYVRSQGSLWIPVNGNKGGEHADR